MSFSKSMGLVLTALVVVGLTLAINDRVFWIRWLSQPPGDTVLTAWHWYQPVEVIGNGPGTPLPVAAVQSRSLSEDALIEAIAYAKSFDSIAFLAAHNGPADALAKAKATAGKAKAKVAAAKPAPKPKAP